MVNILLDTSLRFRKILSKLNHIKLSGIASIGLLMISILIPSVFVINLFAYVIWMPIIIFAILRERQYLSSVMLDKNILPFTILLVSLAIYIALHSLAFLPIGKLIASDIRYIILTFLWIIGILLSMNDKQFLSKLTNCLIFTTAIGAVISVLLSIFIATTSDNLFLPIQFFIYNKGGFGMEICAISGIMAFHTLLNYPKGGLSFPRYYYVIAFLLVTTAITLSRSRSAWIGYCIILALQSLIFIIRKPNHIRNEGMILLLCFSFVALSVLCFLIAASPAFLQETQYGRFLLYIINKGDSYRLGVWQEAASLIWQNPWQGYGINTRFPSFGYPHNIFLSFWYFYGFAAFALFVAFSILIFVKSLWVKKDLWRDLFLFAMITYMLDGHKIFTAVHDEIRMILWLPTAVIISLSTSKRIKNDTTT